MMKNKELDTKLSKMNERLNEIIKKNGYNLQTNEVIRYSQEIDRVIEVYVKVENKSTCPFSNNALSGFKSFDDYYLKDGDVLSFNQKPLHSSKFFRDDFNGGEWLDRYPENNYLKAPVFVRQICCDTVYEKTL
ncbi:MAG: aspartyl-phosphate phosphatase Spo0E family protein, partial [Clostridiales bacterium]